METKNPGSINYSLNGSNSTSTYTYLGQNYYTYPNYYQNWYQPYQQIVVPLIHTTPSVRGPLNKTPQVHITCNKSRTKLYGSNVYMPDNTEFEIELFNPSNETLGVKFKMNGEYISDSMLVLYPGKRMFLDRYLNENKKFKYITYTVDDDKESKDAIANNGNIQVEFYREQWVAPVVNLGVNKTYLSNTLNGNSNGLSGIIGCSGITGSTTNGNTYFTNTASIDEVQCNAVSTDWLSDEMTKSFNEIETGMIAKGGKSEAEFNNVEMDFEMFYTDVFAFKIMPLSLKHIEPKDLVRYCTNCSTKSKKVHKFCAACGTKL